MKSTYRTDETFFSRTHRFGCELQTSDAGWSSKMQKDNNSAAHVRNGMVYLTVPLDRRFRALRPDQATLDPRREWHKYERYDILVAASMGKKTFKTTEIHILVTRCNTYRDSSENYTSFSVSPKLLPNSSQGSTRDTNSLTTRPPTPFIEPPRQEKVNFHRLIELNLIDPEKILIFSFR